MEKLITTMIESLVDYPEQVDINLIHGNETIMIEIRVDPSDVGKIIGKKGVIADALRVIITSAGARLKNRCILQIIDRKN